MAPVLVAVATVPKLAGAQRVLMQIYSYWSLRVEAFGLHSS